MQNDGRCVCNVHAWGTTLYYTLEQLVRSSTARWQI